MIDIRLLGPLEVSGPDARRIEIPSQPQRRLVSALALNVDVVVRSAQPTSVEVTWSGRASDTECTDEPAWALPGFYEVYAAAAGSSPTDVSFEVTKPSVRYVTETPSPTASPSSKKTEAPAAKPPPSPKPSASPTP